MPDVAILSMGHLEDSPGTPRATDAVADAGFLLHVCATVQELVLSLGTGKNPMVVLDVAHSVEMNGFVLSQFLQSVFHCGIVLLVGTASDERIRGLTCGADFCLSEPVQGAELIAVLNALHRRIGEKGVSPISSDREIGTQAVFLPPAKKRTEPMRPGPWVLEDSGWRLRAPNGNSVGLSSTERSFMIQLFRAPAKLVRRDQWNEDFLPSTFAGKKASRIDVMVSRLRRKVSCTAGKFPLHVRRGIGYQFAEPCAIEGDIFTEEWSP
jgi:DNA-binding response OmpR family regulator